MNSLRPRKGKYRPRAITMAGRRALFKAKIAESNLKSLLRKRKQKAAWAAQQRLDQR